MSKDSTLEQIRKNIDAIDNQLLDLISKRAVLAVQVRDIKSNSAGQTSFYRPEREAQILKRITDANPGPLPAEQVAHLFREIIAACLALEERLNIAYLGPAGTFTQAATLKHFGHSVLTTALAGIDQVFREVESGNCQYGVVPIENSIEGVINHTHDMLINSNLKICGEIELRINQHLLSKAASLDTVTRVYSHQQSFGQCRAWLDNHLRDVERIAVNSNAEAAQLAGKDPTSAAIASEAAAGLYGLHILTRNIEDDSFNTTRFMVLGTGSVARSGHDKTSLLFSTPNKPGALHGMLACFSENDVSMTRIESRPSRRGMWDYVFFVDVEGHVEDQNVAAALRQLEQRAAMVKLLGSYPRAVL